MYIQNKGFFKKSNLSSIIIYCTRSVITKTPLEGFVDSLKSAMLYTKVLATGYPVKKFTHKIVQNPFLARNDVELQLAHSYYRMVANSLVFMKPSDRVLLNFIVTRTYANVVNELPHVLYHSKQKGSRLYTIPSERYFNPKDYKAGDAVVHATGESLEFKTKKNLTTNGAHTIAKQFEHVNLAEHKLGLSVVYNGLFPDFDRDAYLRTLLNVGFQEKNIHLISQSECSSMFADPLSIDSALQHYNVKWSVYLKEHKFYVEQHLQKVVQYTQQQDIKEEAHRLLTLMQESKLAPNTIIDPKKVLKSITHFKGYDMDGTHIASLGLVEEPEDIFSDVTDWFDSD